MLVVAGVIGLGGFFPQIIDAEWVRRSVGTHPPKLTPPTSGTTSVAGIEQTAPALTPGTEAMANGLATVPLVATATKTNKPTEKATVAAAKKKVVRVERHRRSASPYAQDGGGWSGGSSRL
jgi:hypothetical protein